MDVDMYRYLISSAYRGSVKPRLCSFNLNGLSPLMHAGKLRLTNWPLHVKLLTYSEKKREGFEDTGDCGESRKRIPLRGLAAPNPKRGRDQGRGEF